MASSTVRAAITALVVLCLLTSCAGITDHQTPARVTHRIDQPSTTAAAIPSTAPADQPTLAIDRFGHHYRFGTGEVIDIWFAHGTPAPSIRDIRFTLSTIQNGKVTEAAWVSCRWDLNQWFSDEPQHTTLLFHLTPLPAGEGTEFWLTLDQGQFMPDYLTTVDKIGTWPVVKGSLLWRHAVSVPNAHPGIDYVIGFWDTTPDPGWGYTSDMRDQEIKLYTLTKNSILHPKRTVVVLTARWHVDSSYSTTKPVEK